MAKWSEKMAYDMDTQRMKKAIQDIIDGNKNRIAEMLRQDERHGDPADHVWVETECPDCAEGTCGCAAPDECGFDGCDCWLDDDNWHSVNVAHGYFPLFSVLNDALNEAQVGKGEERHGNGLSFTEQPALTITRTVGLGFPLGQAMKKIQESQRMDTDAAKRELLGAINYLAAAILFLDE